MYYTVYKTTNLINGKFYIGKHQTKNLDDDYLGSGKLVRYAFKKYGIENFAFEYLGIFDQEWKMNLAEKIYVVLDPEVSYNICPGGQGGFGYINNNKLNIPSINKETAVSFGIKANAAKEKLFPQGSDEREEYNKRISVGIKKYYETNGSHWKGKKHSDEAKLKMRKSKNVGKSNPSYGTCWIMNDVENLRIPKNELSIWLEKGYQKGRKIRL